MTESELDPRVTPLDIITDDAILKPGTPATKEDRLHTGNASTIAALFKMTREQTNYPVVARFTVDGEPASKARARFTNYRGKVRAYTPEATKAAESKIGWLFKAASTGHEVDKRTTYGVVALFFNGTRQRRDVDNMVKLLLDGLNGIAWDDDDQVIEVSARKDYVPKGQARTEVLIYRIGRVFEPTKTCINCGTEFPIYDSTRARKYCTRECNYASRRARRQVECKGCGITFTAPKVNGQIFCSRACIDASGWRDIKCDSCNILFSRQASLIKGKNFCCIECSTAGQDPRKLRGRLGVCSDCGGPTSKPKYIRCQSCNLKHRNTGSMSQIYPTNKAPRSKAS